MLRRAAQERSKGVEEAQRGLLSFPLPALSPEHAVLATDGSQIDLDRHAPLPCYLINIGRVVIRYGGSPQAQLANQPRLLLTGAPAESEEEHDAEAQAHRDRLHLDLERSVAELRGLSELAESEAGPPITLALRDGSLILWTATATRYQRETDHYVRGYVDQMERLRQLGSTQPLALASFISQPGSMEVVTTLQVAASQESPGADGLAEGSLDRDLFSFLGAGERSEVYPSQRGIMSSYSPPENRVHFFYLNVGPEIGRVEVPAWVAQDRALLDFTHAAIYDQCRRNFGYPVALMEAHQQAVVSKGDRQAFWQMVYRRLQEEGLPALDSAKSLSKRIPWS